MSLSKDKLLKAIQSPWTIAAFLLGVFFATTSYKYGWDDQHLEIPLLKNLIDPTLYQGDYYVESLKKNFSSFFYPILAKLIRVEQIPSVYFGLYCISRYFLFFWITKLWIHISKSRFKALLCGLTLILITRVPEFLYRTFSHQEFALAIIFAGIYYFFKNRFILAAILLGVTANFHGLYSLFPMAFLGLSLLLQIKKYGFKTLLKACGTFLITSAPFLIWTIQNRFTPQPGADPHLADNWIALFHLACPQNFLLGPTNLETLTSSFKAFITPAQPYIYVLTLFVLNLVFNADFRKNKNALGFCLAAFLMIIFSFIFTYIYPSRFVLDLNLARNSQYLLFLLTGFTCLLVLETVERNHAFLGIITAGLFFLIKLGRLTAFTAVGGLFFFLGFLHLIKRKDALSKIIALISAGFSVACFWGLIHSFKTIAYRPSVINIYWAILAVLIIAAINTSFLRTDRQKLFAKRFGIALAFAVLFVQFINFRIQRMEMETKGSGWWALQRSWEDMQSFVKQNTPKDSMLLVPYNMEMGGFRILSERKIICSYRDCGIVGFDYAAGLEWQRRVADIEAFKFIVQSNPINAVKNAVTKYKANYIVFMKYAAPKNSPVFRQIYANDHYVLFQVPQ